MAQAASGVNAPLAPAAKKPIYEKPFHTPEPTLWPPPSTFASPRLPPPARPSRSPKAFSGSGCALPFRLDHVNIYLIEDGAGFALLDTGIDDAPTRELWERLLAGLLKGRPLTRIISSHCHPDHIGLAGWLCGRLGLELYASQTEYLDALMIRLDPGALNAEPYRGFYLGHGLSEEQTDLLLSRGLHYLRMVSDLPRTFNRLMAEETLEIGGRSFEVITGGGHASEQVMLYCREGGFILCADQAMAKISPNISVEAINPNGDPLGAYLRSLAALKQRLPADTLALPGHNLPFVGLPTPHRRADRSSSDALRRNPEGGGRGRRHGDRARAGGVWPRDRRSSPDVVRVWRDAGACQLSGQAEGVGDSARPGRRLDDRAGLLRRSRILKKNG